MHRQLDLIEPQQAAASPEFGFLYSGRADQELRKGKKKVGVWVFPKMVVPNNHGFSTENDHFGVFWGYHHFRKPPYTT